MRASSWQLIVQFALKDFKIRYTHSVLGYAWSVLNPLVFALLYYFVFSVFVRFDVPNYPGFLLVGIVLWNFFSEGSIERRRRRCWPAARSSPRWPCRATWWCSRRS